MYSMREGVCIRLGVSVAAGVDSDSKNDQY